MPRKLPEDLTQQYLTHSGGTNLATGQTGRGYSTQGGAIRQEPLPPTPAQVRRDQSDVAKVAPDVRKKIRQAPRNAQAGAIAVGDDIDKVLENPRDRKAIKAVEDTLQQTRASLDQVKGRKGVVKDVRNKVEAVEKALEGVSKGRWGAKGKLEKAKADLNKSGRKLK